MLHNPAEETMFPALPVERILKSCSEGDKVALSPGETIFTEGTENYPFCIVLSGRIRMTRRIAGVETLLVIHEPGQFIGEISILTGGPALATGRAEGPAEILRFSNDQFRHLIAECPELATPVLRAFAARSREVDAVTVQQDKLALLGKMAAGLAHELNNPAAALVRSAAGLREALARVADLGLRYDSRLSDEQRPIVKNMQEYLRKRASDGTTLSPLERSDREESLSTWLEDNGIEDGWEMASALVSAGLTRQCLEGLDGELKPAALSAALTWIEADLSTTELAREIESSAARISDLVQAMKQYTYMDQAQFQVIDIHVGLDATLRIFAHRMKKGAGVEVRRNYDRSLDKICAYPGELNQAWTNLISNALDAMNDSGVLTVTTRRDGDRAVVTIGDNGPGIPPEARANLFRPFFTTKAAGKGTGLGLEIVHRIIVNRHHGSIEVESRPGDTRFTVRLPFVQPKDHEMYPHESDSEREAALERV
jgi:signal transduction histidine kinase